MTGTPRGSSDYDGNPGRSGPDGNSARRFVVPPLRGWGSGTTEDKGCVGAASLTGPPDRLRCIVSSLQDVRSHLQRDSGRTHPNDASFGMPVTLGHLNAWKLSVGGNPSWMAANGTHPIKSQHGQRRGWPKPPARCRHADIGFPAGITTALSQQIRNPVLGIGGFALDQVASFEVSGFDWFTKLVNLQAVRLTLDAGTSDGSASDWDVGPAAQPTGSSSPFGCGDF